MGAPVGGCGHLLLGKVWINSISSNPAKLGGLSLASQLVGPPSPLHHASPLRGPTAILRFPELHGLRNFPPLDLPTCFLSDLAGLSL